MQRGYTLSFDNQYTGEMMKAFMACQKCGKVNTKIKMLKCAHTICMRCAMARRKRLKEAGMWGIPCLVCRAVTTGRGDQMNELKNVTTVQKLVEKTSNSRSNHNAPTGHMTMHATENLSVNVVSSTKEKQEIHKVLDVAKKKIKLCHEQSKQVKQHEKKVVTAKLRIEKQIRESVESYIASIKAHEEQLLENLNSLFKDDFRPVEEARECIDMQMQSLLLVTQCCSVANKILKGGGAPMDMDSFKAMVRQTMAKTKAGKLPNALQRAYKPRVFYKANEVEYDELAERLGKLITRKEKSRKESQHQQKNIAEEHNPEPIEDYEEEPIYDLPPDLEARMMAATSNHDQAEEESLYDEIPFFTQGLHLSTSNNASHSPARAAPSVPEYAPSSPSFSNYPRSSAASPSTSIPEPPPLPPQKSIPTPPPLPPQTSIPTPPPIHPQSSIPTPPPLPSQHPSSAMGCEFDEIPPAPIAKNNHESPIHDVPDHKMLSAQNSFTDDAIAIFAMRRKAINGDDSDFDTESMNSEQSIEDNPS